MNIHHLHTFNVTIKQACEIQIQLATKILKTKLIHIPKIIAGIDISVKSNSEAVAAGVVLSYPELRILEVVVVKGEVLFPYVPGLLSFREMPLSLDVCEKIKSNPDIILVDGQGIAHPRRIGFASHLGLFLDKPTIGCAKSPLFGHFLEPGVDFGSISSIIDNEGETIGAVLRTKSGVKPLYISIGHNIDLASSINWVLKCCEGYRLPQPTRLAHLASKGNL